MIKEIEFQGKKAMAAFVTRDVQPADEADAEMVKVIQGDMIHWLTFDEPEEKKPAQDTRPIDLKVNIRSVGPPRLGYDKAPFDPAKHPRGGKPENAGEFSEIAGGGGTKPPEVVPPAEAPAAPPPKAAPHRRAAQARHPRKSKHKTPRIPRTESYVSPSMAESLTLPEAVKGLHSDRQRMLERVSDQIDRALGLKTAKTAACLGAWADGAENTLMILQERADPALERAAAAMKGHLAQQKAVLLFRPEKDGTELMAAFPLKGSITEIHQKLLAQGIAFHTLEPMPEGGARVHIFAESHDDLLKIRDAAKALGGRVKFTRGNGEFIGTHKSDGTDAEQRADAQRVYEGIIEDAARSAGGVGLGGRDVRGAWQDALGHWRAASERESAATNAQIGDTQTPPPGTKPPPGPAMAPLQGSAPGTDPATISSRLTTGVAADPKTYLRSDLEGMKEIPKVYHHNISLLRDTWNYQNLLPAEVGDNETDDQVARSFIDHCKANLKFLYRMAPKSITNHGHLWYEGAHDIAEDQAARYNLPIQCVAGVYASQSPQKLWDMNVYLGDRILDIYHTKQDFRWDKEMDDTASVIWHNKNPHKDAALQKLVEQMQGKTLAEMHTVRDKARWIRTYDEAHSNLAFQAMSPDGNRGDRWRHDPDPGQTQGDVGIANWQSTGQIANAIKCIESKGDRKIISAAMGKLHKVRCFYNNILDPHSDNGDVTVDTHAVGAALLRGLGAASVPVYHSLMTKPDTAEKRQRLGFVAAKGSKVSGSQGTYPLYADAYREAAAELHIEPRVLQSVTWEAKRLLFGLRPSEAFVKEVEGAWQKYHEGKQSLGMTQQQVIHIARQRNPNGGFFA